MVNAVKIIYADGREEELNRKLSLEQMQKMVGGYIQILPSRIVHRSLVMNEEGLLQKLPPNPKGRDLLHKKFKLHPNGLKLVGNVILIKS